MIKLLNLLYEGPDAPITQRFGANPSSYAQFGLKGHNGVDFSIVNGTVLYSCIDGVVIEAQSDPTGYGNYIKIENDDCGVLYAHLEAFGVAVGETVKAGQVIGKSDNTGNSTGPHLHFGVFPKPRDRGNGYAGYIDPLGSQVQWVESYVDPAPSETIKELQAKVDNLKILLDKSEATIKKLQKDELIKDKNLRSIVDELNDIIAG